MSDTTVRRIARGLRVLLILTMALIALAVLLVPASVMTNEENLFGGAGTFLYDLVHPAPDDITAAGVAGIFLSWVWGVGERGPVP